MKHARSFRRLLFSACCLRDPIVFVLPSNTDGMTADNAGNIYMTALSLDGIMKFDESTRQVSRFVHHPEMNWPDTLAWGRTARCMWSRTTCISGSMVT